MNETGKHRNANFPQDFGIEFLNKNVHLIVMLPSSPSLRAAATVCGAISPPVSTQRKSTLSPMRGNANTEDWPIDKESSFLHYLTFLFFSFCVTTMALRGESVEKLIIIIGHGNKNKLCSMTCGRVLQYITQQGVLNTRWFISHNDSQNGV